MFHRLRLRLMHLSSKALHYMTLLLAQPLSCTDTIMQLEPNILRVPKATT